MPNRRHPEPPTLAPSDWLRRAPVGSLKVGGRVVLHDAGRTMLGDALATLEIRPGCPCEASPGDLLLLRGHSQRGRFVCDEVLEHQPAPESPTTGEHARLSWQGVGKKLEARARILARIRAYFDGAGFIEVKTPTRVRTPGLDAHVDAIKGGEQYLVTTPEFHLKRLLVGGMPRVYSVASCFRAEERGPEHEVEFSMLEWYRAFAGVEQVMLDTERVVQVALEALGGDLALNVGSKRIDLARPFPRMTVNAAFRRYAGVSDAGAFAARQPEKYFQRFVDRVQPALARRRRPLFLTDFPLSQGALARRSTKDPNVVERFELYLGGVELCNGYGELTDPAEHRHRFKLEQERRRQAKAPVYAIDETFMAALDEGLPPAAGNALGLDRLVMLATGATSIQEVMAFSEERR